MLRTSGTRVSQNEAQGGMGSSTGPPGQQASILGAGVGLHTSGDGLGQPAWHLHVSLLLQRLQHGWHALEQIPEGGHGFSRVAICTAKPSDMSLAVATLTERQIYQLPYCYAAPHAGWAIRQPCSYLTVL